jgi:hypothetical protein
MIRKRQPGNFATATVATLATVRPKTLPSVATVASVAVANAETVKTGDGKPCSQWLFHFADRDDLTVTFAPAVDHAAALACYPDAVAAEPVRSETGTPDDTDDRITCRQCSRLTYGGVCSIAAPGAVVSASCGYRPDRDLLQRCEGYEVKP